jgi:hypothetical protein
MKQDYGLDLMKVKRRRSKERVQCMRNIKLILMSGMVEKEGLSIPEVARRVFRDHFIPPSKMNDDTPGPTTRKMPSESQTYLFQSQENDCWRLEADLRTKEHTLKGYVSLQLRDFSLD